MRSNADTVSEVTDYTAGGWRLGADGATRARRYCAALERGEMLLFLRPPFVLSGEDVNYLVSRPYSGSRLHKNVSYRPSTDTLRGFSGASDDIDRVHHILRDYSRETATFVAGFLAPYSSHLKPDCTSFRPLEEDKRKLPLHKRNDLLHVDAFPTRPTFGARILRVFTNINPRKSRVWITSADFRSLAEDYASTAGLDKIASGSTITRIRHRLRSLGIPVPARSAYDEFMLRFHHFLKENSNLQNGAKNRIEFPPMATWLVYTDGVCHAALSGQFALEQTFLVPQQALVSPEDAPIRILEDLCRRPLAA